MKQLPYILIVILVAVIFLQRSCVKPQVPETKIVTKTDTVYKTHTDTVSTYIPVPKVVIKRDTVNHYTTSDNVQELKVQFTTLADDYYSRKIYEDTLTLDSIAKIQLRDTIAQNRIIGRSYTYTSHIPVITTTTTITQPAPLKSQVYIGGEIVGQTGTLLQGAYIGLMLKNRKDQLFGVKGGLDINGKPLLGVSSYWKIKLHK